MNKKMIAIIAAVVAVIVVVCIIIMVTGEKLEEVKLSLQVDALEKTVGVSLGYPKDKGITVENSDSEDFKTIKNEKQNYILKVMINEDTTYAENKDDASKQEGYEEAKFGNYAGYIEKGDYDIEGNFLLENEGNIYVYFTFVLEANESYVNGEEVNVENLYKLEEVQKILKTIKYDKGETTKQATQEKIEEKAEEEKTSNYGEFKDKSRTEGTSDKDGLIFIPSYESPKQDIYKAEQRNDNVGVDNYLWYTPENRQYETSGIEVRVFPKKGEYATMDEYIKEKGDMYHWSKATIGDTEYDVFTFGSDSSTPAKYSKYYSGAFMKGNKVIEFSYNMYAEVPDQDLGDTFFKQIIDSIEYSKDY